MYSCHSVFMLVSVDSAKIYKKSVSMIYGCINSLRRSKKSRGTGEIVFDLQ